MFKLETEVTATQAIVASVQSIFVTAAGDLASMLQPIMTAGVVIVIGISAFVLGRKLYRKFTA